jgi:Mrp family chromosome partitioning ATPase
VLVIDADLHRPSVAAYLGIEPPHPPGLADTLAHEECTLGQSVLRLDGHNLWVLLPGTPRLAIYELLNSPRLGSVLMEARRSFDFVFVDTPPVVPLPDCRVIGQWVDGFMMVVTAHRTPRKAVAEALNLLDPAKLIGLVFNGDDRPLSPYSSYGYSYSNTDRRLGPGGRVPLWRRALPAGPRREPRARPIDNARS